MNRKDRLHSLMISDPDTCRKPVKGNISVTKIQAFALISIEVHYTS